MSNMPDSFYDEMLKDNERIKNNMKQCECQECCNYFEVDEKDINYNDYLEDYMSNGEMRKMYKVECKYCDYKFYALLD